MTYEIVIPTSGRPSLGSLLTALAAGSGPAPERVIVVDDRSDRSTPLLPSPPEAAGESSDGGALSAPAPLSALDLVVVAGAARGPAAARNAGWRAARAEWVVFLDDDVVPPADWRARLVDDLAACGPPVAASQGRIVVPVGERPTDWERNVAGLEHARWATADMAYRRDVLAAVGGFDERFPRAYREDADLGLRVVGAGRQIVSGRRHVVHPVRPASRWVSLTKQAGNADDVLMRRLHGRGWRQRAGVPPGRRPRHLAIAAAGLVATFAPRRAALLLGAGWLAGTAELAWARIAPGPRTPREVATMLWTSAAMPFVATAWWLRGLAKPRPRLAAVLFDRDGTLIEDVPYNGDPARVVPMPGARAALDRQRAAGVRVGVVSNQSGIARGWLSDDDVAAVHARMEALLGPLGPLEYCPHGPDDGCECRKPAPGLILRAAARLGVDPRECAVIGDIGSDVAAALAAGARPVLVPTPRTRPQEVAAAPERAANLADAVALLLEGRAPARNAAPVRRAEPAPIELKAAA